MRLLKTIVVLNVVSACLSTNIHLIKYTRRYEKKAISREVDMSHKYTVSNPLRCALACRSSPICQTFTYSHKDCRCYPQPLHKYEDSLVTADNTALYTMQLFKVKLKGETKKDDLTRKTKNTLRVDGENQSHGQTCEQAEDCGVPDSICHKKTCLCQIGLYYSRSQDKCLGKCDKLANVMDTYTGVGIIDHNDITIFATRQTACFQQCVDQTNITCVSAEWEFSTCQLSKVGFLDVPEKERALDVAPRWGVAVYFGTRQCL